ncbi:MAG: mannose-6-phosphate isomerase, class I [Methylothermaceae bacterium]|nr:mannose-6-phosphate isomerase, class I [Methylothermaceae bacterium]
MDTELELDRLGAAIASLVRRPRPIPLFCGVQQYAWGDFDFIPRLLGKTNPDRDPFAELWIGAHPDLPAQAVIGRTRVSLSDLLPEAVECLLGPDAKIRYQGQLPFLMKILAAGRPLSIQVHPNKYQAEAGFAREDRLKIPLDSPQRNYRDCNHKPELLCALTDFYALKGFRPESEIADQLASIPEWRGLSERFRGEGLKKFYHHLMTLPQSVVDEMLAPVVARLRREGPFPKDRREYWLLRADELYSQGARHDRGLFSLYLLNFLCLRPGEAIFQHAGELHSYLEGVGVEVMANSNNVLRGGLTPKHVDVPALLEIVKFDGKKAEIISSRHQEGGAAYPAPVDEFAFSCLELSCGRAYFSEGPLRLGIVLEGSVRVNWEAGQMRLFRGQSFLIPYGCRCRLQSEDDVVIYLAACSI